MTDLKKNTEKISSNAQNIWDVLFHLLLYVDEWMLHMNYTVDKLAFSQGSSRWPGVNGNRDRSKILIKINICSVMYGSRRVPGKKNILSGGRHLNYLAITTWFSGGRHLIIVSYLKTKLVDTEVWWNLTQLQLFIFTWNFLTKKFCVHSLSTIDTLWVG